MNIKEDQSVLFLWSSLRLFNPSNLTGYLIRYFVREQKVTVAQTEKKENG
jgi:hypothetical protein